MPLNHILAVQARAREANRPRNPAAKPAVQPLPTGIIDRGRQYSLTRRV